MAGFKYQYVDNDGCALYELTVPLPDDGVPNSEQFLRLRVSVPRASAHGAQENPELSVTWHSTIRPGKPVCLLHGEVHDMKALANVLYGAARLRTVEVLQPIKDASGSDEESID